MHLQEHARPRGRARQRGGRAPRPGQATPVSTEWIRSEKQPRPAVRALFVWRWADQVPGVGRSPGLGGLPGSGASPRPPGPCGSLRNAAAPRRKPPDPGRRRRLAGRRRARRRWDRVRCAGPAAAIRPRTAARLAPRHSWALPSCASPCTLILRSSRLAPGWVGASPGSPDDRRQPAGPPPRLGASRTGPSGRQVAVPEAST